MSLLQNLIRRLFLMIPMAIGITLLLFVVTHIVPVNPLAVILTERSMDDPEAVQAATEKWGLDKPLPVQYMVYLKNLIQGDLGVSFKTKNPVASDLKDFLPATIELAICSFIFAILIGLPLGIISGYKSGSFVDHSTRVVSLLGASMPPFWSGLLILFVFYYKLGWASGPGRINPRIGAPDISDRPVCFRLIADRQYTGLLGFAQSPCPAFNHPGLVYPSPDFAHHPLFDAGSALTGLHPHGPCQGTS